MTRANQLTAALVSVALFASATLSALIFFVRVPVRAGSHNLVASTSVGLREVRALPRTYFQTYGTAELVVTGLGLAASALVAVVLFGRSRKGERGAGKVAWGAATLALVVAPLVMVSAHSAMVIVGVCLMLACLNFSRRCIPTAPVAHPSTSAGASILG